MGAMPHLRIADLLANAPIDPEAHLDAVRVERYAQMLDALPPIVVFDTPEGLLLVELCRLRHRPRRAQHRSGLPRPLAAGASPGLMHRTSAKQGSPNFALTQF